MSNVKLGSGVKFPLALFTVIAIATVANEVKTVFLSFGIPGLYASVLGFAVVVPILVYPVSASEGLKIETYRCGRGMRGVSLDTFVIVVVAMVGGSLGTSIALFLISAESWQLAIGVSLAILAGREAFVRRNHAYFEDEGEPGIGDKLGEWLDG